jgi:SAM-dependent methyltransferase
MVFSEFDGETIGNYFTSAQSIFIVSAAVCRLLWRMQPCSHPPDECEILFSASDYISGEQFKIARCRLCQQTVTVPVPADLGKYYPTGYYGDASARRFPAVIEWLQERLYAGRASRVLRLLNKNNPRVLDVGCGRGLLLRAFQHSGCDVTGTEFSDDACRFAREILKIPVRVGLLHDLNFPDSSFDVVIMWHVLEHVSDPRPVLAEVSRILRPGGVFLAGVPNFGSPEAQLTKAGWFHLDVPRHLSHHARAPLTQALQNEAMRPVWTGFFAPEYDCFSFVQSLLNWLGARHNFLYNCLRSHKAKVTGTKTPFGSLLTTALLAPLLGVISVPATLLLGFFGLGATLTVCAVKEDSRKLP